MANSINSLGYTEETIVMFHIGRGGRFNNAGFKRFIGVRKIKACSDYENLFLKYENENELLKKINGRENLTEKFNECRENEDFSFFTKLGFDMGKRIYFDACGNSVELTEEDANSGVGTINIDNSYDTTYTCMVKDLSEEEIELIINSDSFEVESLTELLHDLEMI